MISHMEIVEYWSNHQCESGLSVDWTEAEKRCWRCAGKRSLQRCHIIPRALGGEEIPSNLVLLCEQCHAEAPNVIDPDFMWVWLRAHAAPFYDTYWQIRGFKEYELIFGEVAFSDLPNTDALIKKSKEMLEELLKKTNIHWGQGKINPATVAWVLRQIDQKARYDEI